MEGIAIHGNRVQAARAMRDLLVAYPALNAHNDAFATVCARVYMEIEDRLSLR